eukprot:11155068-Lingulodinium_polyedra.AAC.1
MSVPASFRLKRSPHWRPKKRRVRGRRKGYVLRDSHAARGIIARSSHCARSSKELGRQSAKEI